MLTLFTELGPSWAAGSFHRVGEEVTGVTRLAHLRLDTKKQDPKCRKSVLPLPASPCALVAGRSDVSVSCSEQYMGLKCAGSGQNMGVL